MEPSVGSHFGHTVDEIPNTLKGEFKSATGTSFDEVITFCFKMSCGTYDGS